MFTLFSQPAVGWKSFGRLTSIEPSAVLCLSPSDWPPFRSFVYTARSSCQMTTCTARPSSQVQDIEGEFKLIDPNLGGYSDNMLRFTDPSGKSLPFGGRGWFGDH
jgi:hypothetical protein